MHDEPETVTVLTEPPLEFAFGQRCIDPRDGLSLFGPLSKGSTDYPERVGYVVLGTKQGLATWTEWGEAMNKPWAVADNEKHKLWTPYPGYEIAFGAKWPGALKLLELDQTRLSEAARKKDSHERCFAVVEPFMENLKLVDTKFDTKITLAICIVPEDVWQSCRPESRIHNPIDAGIPKEKKQLRKTGQLDLFEKFDPQQYQLSPDFRRQLKARAMQLNIPVQLIRESTMRLSDKNEKGKRGLTPVSDRMWNLCTTIYYKCGGKPWKLSGIREGVTYVGFAFKKTDKDSRSACCVAQMFLPSGDGIVFLGDEGPWYSEEDKDFHLPSGSAEKLLNGVLQTYAAFGDKSQLTEIFLHCPSSISVEEYEGYRKACPETCKLSAVRVKQESRGLRLFRTGKMPVMRGTFWKQSARSGYLFGVGFKPRLGTYDGAEVPVPMRIDIQHGDASIEQVAQDILALTKLNYNACRLGENEPVTIRFSEAVGEILLANPAVTDRRHNFKFYI